MKTKPPSIKGKWRQGKKVGRTLYIDNILVGVVDTSEIAKAIVDKMNNKKEH